MLFYLGASVSWMVVMTTALIFYFNQDSIYDSDFWFAIVLTIYEFFSNAGIAFVTIGIWQFAFENWIVSRELPKILHKQGILTQENLTGKFLISLDKLDEKAYSLIQRIVSGSIVGYSIAIVIGKIITGLLSDEVVDNSTLLTVLSGISDCLPLLPCILTFFFHGKSVLTIYQTTKLVPKVEANLYTMVLHLFVVYLFLLSILLLTIFEMKLDYGNTGGRKQNLIRDEAIF